MATTVGKRRPGRPSKYDTGFKADFCDLARKLGLLGATEFQMAAVFGIGTTTLTEWKERHPEFAQAMNEGKLIADANVASSLYHRAMGYEHDDTDIRVINDRIVKTKIRKHYPPDTGACIFWLKNRAGWRDKVETGLTDAAGKDVTPADPLELARSIAFLLHKGAQTK